MSFEQALHLGDVVRGRPTQPGHGFPACSRITVAARLARFSKCRFYWQVNKVICPDCDFLNLFLQLDVGRPNDGK